MGSDRAFSRLVAGDANLDELFDKADFDAVAVFLTVSYLNDNAIELGIGDGSEAWHGALETCAMIGANPYTTRERLGVDAAMAEAAAAAGLDADEFALLLEGIGDKSLQRVGAAYDLEEGTLNRENKSTVEQAASALTCLADEQPAPTSGKSWLIAQMAGLLDGTPSAWERERLLALTGAYAEGKSSALCRYREAVDALEQMLARD